MAYKVALQAMFFAALAVARSDKRIMGGVPVQAGELPYIVKVGLYCGGALLDSTTVVTAAHCHASYFNDKWVESPAKPNVRAPVASFIAHPEYYNGSPSSMQNDTLFRRHYGNDIAIVKLSTPLEGDGISYVKLPARELELAVGSTGVTAGWGQGSGDILHKVELQILDSCKIAGRRIQVEEEFCVDGNSGSSCRGDSGGPFVDKDTGVLIGVTGGARCSILRYTSFTNVAKHLAFIKQYVNSTSGSA